MIATRIEIPSHPHDTPGCLAAALSLRSHIFGAPGSRTLE
jgi:hypothetical protein